MACKAMNCRGPSVRLVRSGLRSSLTRAHGLRRSLDGIQTAGKPKEQGHRLPSGRRINKLIPREDHVQCRKSPRSGGMALTSPNKTLSPLRGDPFFYSEEENFVPSE